MQHIYIYMAGGADDLSKCIAVCLHATYIYIYMAGGADDLSKCIAVCLHATYIYIWQEAPMI